MRMCVSSPNLSCPSFLSMGKKKAPEGGVGKEG